MAENRVHLVAVDFNGACWWRHGRTSTIERASASSPLLLLTRLVAAPRSGRGPRRMVGLLRVHQAAWNEPGGAARSFQARQEGLRVIDRGPDQPLPGVAPFGAC